MKAKDVARVMFEVIVTAAALKAALTTLSRPMSGEPATKASGRVGGRAGRLGPITVEDLPGYDADMEPLDYEDLL